MKKGNAAFTSFLDDKFVPLQPKIKLVIVVCVVIIPIAIFYFSMFDPNNTKIKGLESQATTLRNTIASVKAKAANRAELQQELAAAKKQFLQIATLLPDEKEIPQLLKDISALGRVAGLDFLSFQPGADIPKDFYSEIPVIIKTRGPYHNVGFFFDEVSKLQRIVTVSNTNMSSPKMEEGEMLLNSDCTLVTYRFTDRELPKPTQK